MTAEIKILHHEIHHTLDAERRKHWINKTQPEIMRDQLIEALDYFIGMGMDEELQDIFAERHIRAMGK